MKYKVMQQVADSKGLGGVGKAYLQLIESDCFGSFIFCPLEQMSGITGFSVKAIRAYIKEIKEFKPDLIHVRGAMVDGLNALIAARLYGHCKIVMSVHGLYSDFREANELKKKISEFLIEPLIFSIPDAVITVYKGGLKRKKINRWAKWLWGYVYNPLPNWDYSNHNEIRHDMRIKLDIPESNIVVTSISRFEYDKGYSYISDAISKLNENWPCNLTILLVGQGKYKERFLQQNRVPINEKKIIVCDATRNVIPYYYMSDVFLTASLHENHSNALLEACASHIPSIATNVGGNSETIQDGIGGWIIQSQDSDRIAELIVKVSKTSKDELKKMGENAFQYASVKFEKETVYGDLARCYNDVIEGRR